jgi:hypothetical protein
MRKLLVQENNENDFDRTFGTPVEMSHAQGYKMLVTKQQGNKQFERPLIGGKNILKYVTSKLNLV